MKKNEDFKKYNFKISDEHFSIINKIGLSPNFSENILPTLINLKNEERSFCLDREDSQQFINKYYYSVNNLLLSLNAYLLENHLELNESSKEKIYQRKSRINTIANLFFDFLKRNIKNTYSKHYLILCELYIYENLYRHQISHGWMRIFKNVDSNSMDLELINTEELENLTNNEDLSKLKMETFDKLRETLKEARYNHLYFDNFVSLENIKDKIICEPIFQTKIKNLFKNNAGEKDVDKYNLNISHYKEDSEFLIITFSLNNLIRTILNVVKIIDYCPTLKEILKK